LRNLPSNLTASATPGQVDVTLTGASEALVRIEPNTVTAYVDLLDWVPASPYGSRRRWA
jgi:hypothetical protein